MTISIPRVSVLVTTHNGAETIGESIASILAQSMPDFELIVVDDASSDATPILLHAICDPRVIIIRSDEQLGIAGARNRGLAACRARHIAMLDHDDVSDSRRLDLQSTYLDGHPEVVLVGTGVQELSDRGLAPEDQPAHTSPPLLRLLLHLDNPLAWSSIMLRRAALDDLTPPLLRSEFEPADDFDLYHRLLGKGEIARLDTPLTTYRWHAANASRATSARMAERAAQVLARVYINWFGAEAMGAASIIVRHSSDRETIKDPATMAQLRCIIGRVADRLAKARPAEREAIMAGAQLVSWRLTRAAVRSGRLSLFRPPAPAFDAAASLVIGAIRAGMRWSSAPERQA